jgi:hypothetical protein
VGSTNTNVTSGTSVRNDERYQDYAAGCDSESKVGLGLGLNGIVGMEYLWS